MQLSFITKNPFPFNITRRSVAHGPEKQTTYIISIIIYLHFHDNSFHILNKSIDENTALVLFYFHSHNKNKNNYV